MLGFSPLSAAPLSGLRSSGFTASLSLAPAISVFAFTGAEKFSAAIALTPLISVFALTGAEKFSAAIALAESAPTTAITGNSFIVSGSLTLTQGVSVFSLTEAELFIVASLNLTQPGSSTIVIDGSHNSLTAWVPPVIDNTRRRNQQAELKQLRVTAPELKQLRQTCPRLGE